MILRNFNELIGVAKVRGRRTVAVARAEEESVLEGLRMAWEDELVEPVLVGDGRRIEALVGRLGLPPGWRVVHAAGDDCDAARRAVQVLRDGEAELLMKGQMQTSTLFKAVLEHSQGLPKNGILSHIAFVEIASYPKLFGATDGGLTVQPSFEQKVRIVRNAAQAFHRLGYRRPKIGLLSYVERVKEGDPETMDWRRIVEMAQGGAFGDVVVEGPLAMDLCLSLEAKRVKRVDSEVAANVDVIVAPNITACNASTKALILQGGSGAGVVVGASAPIVALSRGDAPKTRLCSIAAAIAMLPERRSDAC
ncbi:MAG: hypothetical protein C4523_16320 [Myxococcales bacterium]|nr:MAG: hypothetical protein C4523_16320 [Myxococcales bacterium]